MNNDLIQVIEWLLSQDLSPLPVAPQQDSRKFPKVNKASGKNFEHCPLDNELNPIPLFTGKNPSYLDKKGIPNLVNHSKYQKELPTKSILKVWFANPQNGIGALGKDDFCWLDLDAKNFESEQDCENALNKIFERCPELMGAICEKTHSKGYRIGFRVKEPKTFTNFAIEENGGHVGELLGAGRFAVLAPTIGSSGNAYQNISRPDKLPVLEKIDFVYPVGAQPSKPKTPKPLQRPQIEPSGEAIHLAQCLSPNAFAVYNGDDIKDDESYSLTILFKEAQGWQNWLSEQGIPFHGSADSITHYGANNLGLDEAKCDRVIKSVKDQENLQPAASFQGGDKSCWLKILKLSKQVYGQYCPASMKDDISEKETTETPKKTAKVKTKTPLKEPEGYKEEAESKQQERYYEVVDDPEYPYNVKAVEEIYKSGHYISFEERLYKWNGKFYEKCDPGEEKQKIRAWAEQTPVYDPRTKRETYKYLGTRYLNEIWNWALITFAIKPDLVNPPGLNLANGVLRVHVKGKVVSWELTKHSPKDYFLYCSDVEFNKDANPEFCDHLLECLDPAPRTAFLRQVGAALDLEAVRKVRGRDIRAAICRGSGSNGKDSLHEAIALIFTDNQICSAGFNQFIAYDQGRQFTLAKLRGAKINWAPENNKNNSLDGSQSLNQAISGDRGLEYERKGKDAESFIPHCVHFFNVNQLPKITTGLESIMSRFAVYEFNKTFSMNPNPAKGELQADPRFKYDKDFIIKEVCPSLLNKMLAELKHLLLEGIDYNAIKHSLDDIQEESTHLWAFCHDLGITASSDTAIYVTDLWEALKEWYIETGTMEPLPEGEKGKPIFHDQANPYDRNITGSNQITKRFQTLFPKITRERETRDPKNKGRFYLKGLKCNNSASLLHFPINSSVSASPSASLSFTSSSLTTGEAKSEDKKELVKQEILTQQGSEAVKQKNTHQALNSQTTHHCPNFQWVSVKEKALEQGDLVRCEEETEYWLIQKLIGWGWLVVNHRTGQKLELADERISWVALN